MGISKNTLRVVLPMIEDIVKQKYAREMEEGKEWFDMAYFIDYELFSIIKASWQKEIPEENKQHEPLWAEIVGNANEHEYI